MRILTGHPAFELRGTNPYPYWEHRIRRVPLQPGFESRQMETLFQSRRLDSFPVCDKDVARMQQVEISLV